MSDDLVTWLRAQLDDDERVARATTERQPYDEWDAVGAQGDDDAALSRWGVTKIAAAQPTPAAKSIAQHIARHDPARVLAEVDAKRRILDEAEQYSPELEHGDNGEWAFGAVLRLLALPYADRPGYRDEWKP